LKTPFAAKVNVLVVVTEYMPEVLGKSTLGSGEESKLPKLAMGGDWGPVVTPDVSKSPLLLAA